jgi:tRNA1Val (adenine37-N6)-methyltransferase
MSTQFQFKQFTITQDLCAMKVGTDGVLLGAWTRVIEEQILDIGSGTGLITLMLAQRTKRAQIDAIDINQNAFLQTSQNIKKSPWGNRINPIQTSLQEFDISYKYDLIISNPPFFANSTKAPQKDRNIARHTDHLPYMDLIRSVTQLLKDDGIFSVILPFETSQLFINEAEGEGLYLNRKCLVKQNPSKLPKRVLMEFSFNSNELNESELTIETEKRHHYTKEYIILTQDFYLNL